MRSRPSSPPSQVNLAGTASAVMALVVMTAAMTSIKSLAQGRLAPLEARATMSETAMVRGVAAAVVAAARELAGAERLIPIHATPQWTLAATATQPLPLGAAGNDHALACRLTVSERLLDLPPPGC